MKNINTEKSEMNDICKKDSLDPNRMFIVLFIKRKAKTLAFQPYCQFYNSSVIDLTYEYQSLRTKMNDTACLLVQEINKCQLFIKESDTINFIELISFNKNDNRNITSTISTRKIENIYSHLTFEYQSLRTKMNDTSSLLQVREINSDTEEKVQSLEYQTVSETINTEKSKLVMELNDRNNIEICKVSLVPNYEIVNAGYEDYIFYEKVKYTINEFLENQQKEIESLTEDNRLLEDYLSNEHKEINKDILALQKKIDKFEKWHLSREFGEY
ncbi:24321_t:CDS:2 [Gigaspora rosea]|nr:24321_t:CDS:2 [Gigaspora rosea]